jgi:hypothetical protein
MRRPFIPDDEYVHVTRKARLRVEVDREEEQLILIVDGELLVVVFHLSYCQHLTKMPKIRTSRTKPPPEGYEDIA